jgi:hypothetical protein
MPVGRRLVVRRRSHRHDCPQGDPVRPINRGFQRDVPSLSGPGSRRYARFGDFKVGDEVADLDDKIHRMTVWIFNGDFALERCLPVEFDVGGQFGGGLSPVGRVKLAAIRIEHVVGPLLGPDIRQ